MYRTMTVRRLGRLLLNAWCPNLWGFRTRVSAWLGLQLTSQPGCQAELSDELDFGMIIFTVTSLLSVLPLLLYWYVALSAFLPVLPHP